MKIIAFDQASIISGYAVFEDNKILEYGKITANQKDIGERLMYIKKEVIKLLDKYNPDFVVYEDIQLQNNVGGNVQTFKILAEVIGIMEELLTEREIPHTAVLAAVWKSSIGIQGKRRNEQKKNTQLYVQQKYDIKATQDESDAIGIGTYYLNKDNISTIKIKNNGFDWS